MTENPFDVTADDWQVVLDRRGWYALWREFMRVPAGWQVVFSAPHRDAALDYIAEHSTGPGPVRRAKDTP